MIWRDCGICRDRCWLPIVPTKKLCVPFQSFHTPLLTENSIAKEAVQTTPTLSDGTFFSPSSLAAEN
jgi:hypothetical protein